MAQLNDTLISGDLRVTGTAYGNQSVAAMTSGSAGSPVTVASTGSQTLKTDPNIIIYNSGTENYIRAKQGASTIDLDAVDGKVGLWAKATSGTSAAWICYRDSSGNTFNGNALTSTSANSLVSKNTTNHSYYTCAPLRADDGVRSLTPMLYASEGSVTGVTADTWVKVELGNLNTGVYGKVTLSIGCPASNAPFQIRLVANAFRYGPQSVAVVERTGYDSNNNINRIVAYYDSTGYLFLYLHVVATNGTLYWGSDVNLSTANNFTVGLTSIPSSNTVEVTVPYTGGFAVSANSYIGTKLITHGTGGNDTTPVYVNSSGVVQSCNTVVAKGGATSPEYNNGSGTAGWMQFASFSFTVTNSSWAGAMFAVTWRHPDDNYNGQGILSICLGAHSTTAISGKMTILNSRPGKFTVPTDLKICIRNLGNGNYELWAYLPAWGSLFANPIGGGFKVTYPAYAAPTGTAPSDLTQIPFQYFGLDTMHVGLEPYMRRLIVVNTSTNPPGWVKLVTATTTGGEYASCRVIGKYCSGNGNWDFATATMMDFQAFLDVTNNTAELHVSPIGGNTVESDLMRIVRTAANEFELQVNIYAKHCTYSVFYSVEYERCSVSWYEYTTAGSTGSGSNLIAPTYDYRSGKVLGTGGSSTVPVYVDSMGHVKQCTPSSMTVGTATKATKIATVAGIGTKGIPVYLGSDGYLKPTTMVGESQSVSGVISNTPLRIVHPTVTITEQISTGEEEQWINETFKYELVPYSTYRYLFRTTAVPSSSAFSSYYCKITGTAMYSYQRPGMSAAVTTIDEIFVTAVSSSNLAISYTPVLFESGKSGRAQLTLNFLVQYDPYNNGNYSPVGTVNATFSFIKRSSSSDTIDVVGLSAASRI